MKCFTFVLTLLAVGTIVSAQNYTSVTDCVDNIANLTSLGTVLQIANTASNGTFDVLSNGNYTATVFAPSNSAFTELLALAKVSPSSLSTLGPLLAEVLMYHVIPNTSYNATVLSTNPIGTRYPTLISNQTLGVVANDTAIFVVGNLNNAGVITNVTCGATSVFLIDRVLIPNVTQVTSALGAILTNAGVNSTTYLPASTVNTTTVTPNGTVISTGTTNTSTTNSPGAAGNGAASAVVSCLLLLPAVLAALML